MPVACLPRVDYFHSQMNSNLIRQRWHETTTPFVFRLSDGTRVPVAHPDFMMMIPGQIIVSSKTGQLTRIDPLHVVAIEEGASKAKRNGKTSH